MHADMHMLMIAMKMYMKMKMAMAALRTVVVKECCLQLIWVFLKTPPIHHMSSMFATGGPAPHQPPACASLLDNI